MNPQIPASIVTATSRRQFLKTSALVGGGALLASMDVARFAHAAGSDRVRLGVIGCGGRGSWIASLFGEHGGYEIVGAADYFEEKTAAVAAKFQLKPEQTFNGVKCHEKMIAKGGLDAVAIISPPYFHPEQAHAAVEAGLNVYLAKPLAVDVPGCRSIKESGQAASKKGKVFLVDFQTRTNEFFIEAMKRVHAGALGEIAFGESSYQCGRLGAKGPSDSPEARLKNWVFDKGLSGDIIVEQNIHTLDVMNWAMNNVAPVRCTGTGGRKVRVDVGDCWDYFTLVYEYPKQVGITFNSRQFDADGPGGIINKMYGSKGVLLTEYGGNVMIRGGTETFYRGGKTGGIYKEGAQANIKTFHDAIGAKEVSNPTVETGVTSNLVAIMGRMAAYSNQPVTWDDVMKSEAKCDGKLDGLKA